MARLGRSLLAAALLHFLGAGCTVPDDTKQCSGGTYTAYLSAVLTAKLSYEKRCGYLDPQGSRDTQRKALLQNAYPAYLVAARDQSATNKRASWDPSCVAGGLMNASCATGAADAVIKGCAGKETTGCLAAGRTCNLPEECDHAYCKGLAAGSSCGSGTCTAWGAAGAACPDGSIDCDPASAFCKNGSCQPLLQAGATCQSDRDCGTGLNCLLPSANAALGACGMPAVGKQGDACDLSASVGKLCGPGLSCYQDMLSVYRCQPTVMQGQTCAASEACAPPLTCVRAVSTDATGKCQPLGGPGAVCSVDPRIGSGCQLTLGCYSFDPNQPAVCQPLPDNGQRCVPMQLDCLVGICDTTQNPPACRPKSATGVACRNDTECISGVCTSGKCQTPVCQ